MMHKKHVGKKDKRLKLLAKRHSARFFDCFALFEFEKHTIRDYIYIYRREA